MENKPATLNELESRLRRRKDELLSRVESDRRLLESQSLFDVRAVYLAELEQNQLPYTELDTKQKFIDMIVFMTRRRLESICIAAAEARVASEEELSACMAKLDEVESDWQKKLRGRRCVEPAQEPRV